ncbi:hypothetical protein RRG08_034377 [Elysia crispata]|uniref:Uncharacterized protein n=1 Tax=Elysia crispata TaxID=231223 RepID=A0AAE1CWN0_9GAST|nr:hypothetical protein RRG08_034377 [Elysia crispata]
MLASGMLQSLVFVGANQGLVVTDSNGNLQSTSACLVSGEQAREQRIPSVFWRWHKAQVSCINLACNSSFLQERNQYIDMIRNLELEGGRNGPSKTGGPGPPSDQRPSPLVPDLLGRALTGKSPVGADLFTAALVQGLAQPPRV